MTFEKKTKKEEKSFAQAGVAKSNLTEKKNNTVYCCCHLYTHDEDKKEL